MGIPFLMPVKKKPKITADIVQGAWVQQSDIVDALTFTFTGLTGGVTSASWPIIGVMGRSASALTLSSVTLGGLPCTVLSQYLNGTTLSAFLSAPRGTTGNLVVNWASATNVVRMLASLVPLTNVRNNLAPTMTQGVQTTVSGPNVNIDCAAGGWIGALAYDGGGAGTTFTWTNLTEKFDVNLESAAAFSGAGDVFATAQTARNIKAQQNQPANGTILNVIAMR